MDGLIPGGWDGSIGRAAAWALVLARVLGLCLTAPGIATPGFPIRFRLLLAAMLGAVLAPLLSGQVTAPQEWSSLAWASLGEMLSGAILGMMAGLIVAGARAAGDLVAAQAGLSTSTLFDPEAGGEVTAIGRLYGWVATLTFLSMGGPIALVRAWRRAMQSSRPGSRRSPSGPSPRRSRQSAGRWSCRCAPPLRRRPP